MYKEMVRLKPRLHFLHVLKDAKPQARRVLLVSASDDLVKALVECAANTLTRNHKLTKNDKSKWGNCSNRLRALRSQRLILKVNIIF